MQRSSTRELVHLAWPMLVAQLAMMGNAVIDTAMAGRLSVIDLAAVGIAASILATVLMSLVSVLFALPPIIAHLYGANRQAEIGREIHQGVWVSLALALVAVLLLLFPGPFIAISDLQPAVETKVRAYLAVSAWGVPGAFALRLFFGLSMGIGRPRPVMFFALLSLALKVPLNALFMYGLLGFPEMGGPGCAVATALDAWLMAALAWGWCLNHPKYVEFQLRQRFTAPDFVAIREFLKLGIPMGLTFIADVTAFTFMALFIARLGPVVSGAHQIAANLAALAFMIPLSLGNATSVLVGQALGAGQAGRARHICWEGIRLGMSIAAVLSLTYWLGAPYIAAFYTTDLQVRAIAIPLIAMVGLYHLGDALQAVSVNALRGYKTSVVPMVIYTVTLWVPGLGGGILLGLTDTFGAARGAPGFWLAGIGSIWLVGGLMAVYLNFTAKKHCRRGL
ncbi:MATE family efflux transporter [Sulfurimicrobium lacus]|uniref:Multidrug-efflux transporter n=1 Tax=Sulfurimicrobium lacus TaxID=2715678 RepID=A0A6F8V9A0_9PROT|nr:MATE family efflux transporter [Sulfurimicrobium lacus]BCB25711.1 MATE family efflux transporter [Sulfurimicrobium lacus]